jgi:hypothetical protein
MISEIVNKAIETQQLADREMSTYGIITDSTAMELLDLFNHMTESELADFNQLNN